MNGILRFLALIGSILAPFNTVAASQIGADLGGFVHQVTLHRENTRTRIRQWVSPIQVRLPFVGGNLEVHTALMYVQQRGDSADEMWGPLDTRFTGTWNLKGRGILSLQATLPTGGQGLEARHLDLIRTLSRNDLNFPVKSFGEGLDIGAGFSVAKQSGHLGISLGLGYLRKGPYAPVESVSGYKPGDEASVTFGLDYTWNKWIYSFSAVGTLNRTDRLDGLVVFQNGKQILLRAGIHHTGRTFRLQAAITEIVRLKNRALIDSQFFYESRDSNGNDLRIHLRADWAPAPFLTFFALGHLKHLTPNAYGGQPESPLYQGRARLWGGGGGLAFSPGGKGRLVLRADRWDGSAEDGRVQLSAYNLRGVLAFQF